jgi:PAS domain S-box-containing protein
VGRFPVAKAKKQACLDKARIGSSGTNKARNEPWEQLLSIFDAIDEKIYIVDPDSHEILYANPTTKMIFGQWAPSEKCHKILQDLDEPCDFCTNPLILGENLGKAHIWEFRNRKTGKWVRCIDRAIKWCDGRMVRFEMSIDIHNRKVAEDALRSSEEKYRQLVENINEVIYSADRNGMVTYVSPAIESLTAHTPSEVVGRHFSEFIHPEDYEKVVNRYGQALSGQEKPTEYRLLKKSGECCWVRTFSRPISNGDEIVGLQGVISEITEQKRAEAALRESEQRYREVLATMNDSFRMVDENGIVTYVNEKLCSMLGYKEHELIDRPVSDFLDKENKRIWDREFKRRKKGDSSPYEISQLTKEGRLVKTLVSPRPVFDKDKCFKGSFSVITDITDLKKTEEALKQRERELNAKTLNLEEMNAALRVLLKEREIDRTRLEEEVLLNVKHLISPYVEKLKRMAEGRKQKTHLEVLESNLRNITSSFSRDLDVKYRNLTPAELRVAGLIREGRTTKEIAELLNLSDRTIESHRRNLRKKMGLKYNRMNLRTTLLTVK